VREKTSTAGIPNMFLLIERMCVPNMLLRERAKERGARGERGKGQREREEKVERERGQRQVVEVGGGYYRNTSDALQID
jgi:hypothetical protein